MYRNMFISITQDKSLIKHGVCDNNYLINEFTRLLLKGFICIKKDSNKGLSCVHSVLTRSITYYFVRGSVQMFHYNHVYRTTPYRGSHL